MNRKKRILLVDDDVGLLRLLTMRLEAQGYEVFPSSNPSEARNRLRLLRPDLLITDLRMDGMDGMELFRCANQSNPGMPVILITAHGSIPDAVAATQEGIFSFIPKPIDKNALLQTIAKALKASGPLSETTEDIGSEQFIARSAIINELLTKARLMGRSDVSVLIRGQGGVGKSLLAEVIHSVGSRKDRPFISFDCRDRQPQELEMELFGTHQSVAGYTREGALNEAEGGTLLLKEISAMPMNLQSRLVRVLVNGKYRPLGAGEDRDVSVRVLATTRVDLDEALKEGLIREDLYYQLNVVSLDVPSLEERPEDIPLLVNQFLKEIVGKHGSEVNSMAPGAIELLTSARWPGNVRQLYQVIEQLVALTTSPVIPTNLVAQAIAFEKEESLSFSEARSEFERDYLIRLLQLSEGNVSRAARSAKRNRTDFYKLLNRHKIEPGMFKKKTSALGAT
ncbi:MAG: two-component system response regulator GlrR [Zetaproteobacteria bacterium]|nr:two-component system response regulator GlrR [Pseudobdellovibrionaceae bacterium]